MHSGLYPQVNLLSSFKAGSNHFIVIEHAQVRKNIGIVWADWNLHCKGTRGKRIQFSCFSSQFPFEKAACSAF